MNLNQKQFEKLAKAIAIAARLSEIERFEGYVPSSQLLTRKKTLKKQLAVLTDEETEEKDVHIRIEIPTGEVKKDEKKEKSFSFNLKDLLRGKSSKDNDDDDDTYVVLQKLIPQELKNVYGKIITEL